MILSFFNDDDNFDEYFANIIKILKKERNSKLSDSLAST